MITKFRAYDHVYFKFFYSKDFKSLAEFFALFDNVQYTIELIEEETISSVLEKALTHITNNCENVEQVKKYVENLTDEHKEQERLKNPKWETVPEGMSLLEWANTKNK
jgi:hypothetical protein